MPKGSHVAVPNVAECLGVDIRNFFDDFVTNNRPTRAAFEKIWEERDFDLIWGDKLSYAENKEITFVALHRAIGFAITDVVDKTHNPPEHPYIECMEFSSRLLMMRIFGFFMTYYIYERQLCEPKICLRLTPQMARKLGDVICDTSEALKKIGCKEATQAITRITLSDKAYHMVAFVDEHNPLNFKQFVETPLSTERVLANEAFYFEKQRRALTGESTASMYDGVPPHALGAAGRQMDELLDAVEDNLSGMRVAAGKKNTAGRRQVKRNAEDVKEALMCAAVLHMDNFNQMMYGLSVSRSSIVDAQRHVDGLRNRPRCGDETPTPTAFTVGRRRRNLKATGSRSGGTPVDEGGDDAVTQTTKKATIVSFAEPLVDKNDNAYDQGTDGGAVGGEGETDMKEAAPTEEDDVEPPKPAKRSRKSRTSFHKVLKTLGKKHKKASVDDAFEPTNIKFGAIPDLPGAPPIVDGAVNAYGAPLAVARTTMRNGKRVKLIAGAIDDAELGARSKADARAFQYIHGEQTARQWTQQPVADKPSPICSSAITTHEVSSDEGEEEEEEDVEATGIEELFDGVDDDEEDDLMIEMDRGIVHQVTI